MARIAPRGRHRVRQRPRPGSLPEQSFDNRPGTWRVVVDYPFDEEGYTSKDDIDRIDRLLTTGDRHTVVWLPRFFTDAAMADLALLVKLDWLFTGGGERWNEYSDHLSATDRAQARGILENLRSGTMTSFQTLLKQAYGIEPADPNASPPSPSSTTCSPRCPAISSPNCRPPPPSGTRLPRSSIRRIPRPTPTIPRSSPPTKNSPPAISRRCATTSSRPAPPRRSGTHQPGQRPQDRAPHRRPVARRQGHRRPFPVRRGHVRLLGP
ncbi:phage resistance PglY domain protein [Mycobacterium xenopi 3993]|nr:phage resistance PglY domain protein [Mycobacterium xenopi 3993]